MPISPCVQNSFTSMEDWIWGLKSVHSLGLPRLYLQVTLFFALFAFICVLSCLFWGSWYHCFGFCFVLLILCPFRFSFRNSCAKVKIISFSIFSHEQSQWIHSDVQIIAFEGSILSWLINEMILFTFFLLLG
jgi:hypothetical protein